MPRSAADGSLYRPPYTRRVRVVPTLLSCIERYLPPCRAACGCTSDHDRLQDHSPHIPCPAPPRRAHRPPFALHSLTAILRSIRPTRRRSHMAREHDTTRIDATIWPTVPTTSPSRPTRR